ncbi:hypothetical protein SAMN04515671_2916 [Nakamurella panacisegetis]|uniref:Uncharacterized protein n=1 Tax=Nakamurella panacisegetis TaxID=1090615 RepID=A0A1H0PWQ6_9ACTN|nr:hypothetical protein [Nakamurella panacisegetis]SDP09105.1 hypothetical protein SAMN04515671_2916 [Nakamurella panacisegetis]
MAASSPTPRRSTAKGPTRPKAPTRNADDFSFELSTGETITLPSMATVELTFRQRRTITHAGESAAMVLVLEWFAEDQIDLLDEIKDAELARLYKAWGRHSGASLGE